MSKNWRTAIHFISAIGIVFFNYVSATQLHYPSNDTVIASWKVTKSSKLTAEQAIHALEKANQLNSSPFLTLRAKQTLEHLEQQGQLNSHALLLKAKLQQQVHLFSEAETTLTHLLMSTPNYIGAHLLMSSVLINQGKFDKAASHCQKLVGKVGYVTAMTCLLEARFEKQPSEKLYQQLIQISQIRVSEVNTFNSWNAEVLAYMAQTLGKPLQAIQHLNQIDLKQAPVSLVALWADIHISLDHSSQVLSKLGKYLEQPENTDDAILLRLAVAEKNVSSTHKWQEMMAQRVQLREWRNDFAHAGQLAQYFMTITPNKEKALKYARRNWAHARSAKDRRLLSAAEQLANERISESTGQ